jgi:hypothetical protein
MTCFDFCCFFLRLSTFILTSITAHGQHISIGTMAGSNISIQSVNDNSLNFGNLIKGASLPNSVPLSGAAVFEISAPEGSALTVWIDAPSTLIGPDGETIPFSLKFAYSNQGLVESKARLNAVEVNKGLNMVTFPVKRSVTGLMEYTPGSMESNNTIRTTGKAYLYIYGSAGPPDFGAGAGEYAGTVNISVEYTSY